MIRKCGWCEPPEPEPADGAIRGLIFAVLLSLGMWGLIVACIIWPVLVLVIGLGFTASCFWKAWTSRHE
jgi:hypothetical protein